MIVCFSFDDGRSDAFEASQIMNKYNFKGSFHVTTGFIDKSFKTNCFGINRESLTIEQIKDMSKNGHYFSSHGDKHVMNNNDFLISYHKLVKWLGANSKVGFSVPNSQFGEEELEAFVCHNKDYLSYVRVGRSKRCYSFKNKVFYVLYNIFKLQLFYDKFNKYNLLNLNEINRYHLTSLVVKRNTKVKNLIRFIKKNNKNEVALILMFHSVVKKAENKWEYSIESFEKLCEALNHASAKVCSIEDLVKFSTNYFMSAGICYNKVTRHSCLFIVSYKYDLDY